MKHVYLLTIVFLSVALSAQDLPNGTFEEWEVTPMFSLDPLYWQTDNTQLLVSTSQDTDAYEGEYAMRVDPLVIGIGEYGEANTTIEMGGLPEGLHFYVKYQRTLTAAVGVTVDFFNEEDIVHSEYWTSTDTVSTWMPVQMTFPPIDIATTHAVIRVFTAIGDFASGDGWISVDAMAWGAASGLNDFETYELNLFPNPTSGFLEIALDEQDLLEEVRVLDMNGRAVLHMAYAPRIDVTELAEGTYILELLNASAVVSRKTFIIKR